MQDRQTKQKQQHCGMRLQKFLRDNGLGALRKCDLLVQQKKIKVNDVLVNEPTMYLKPGDVISCEKMHYTFNPLPATKVHSYYKFNKPKYVLCSHKKLDNKPLIFDYLARNKIEIKQPLFFAGRLDYESAGLMIVSTDGQFINKIAHPSFGLIKQYQVRLQRNLNAKQRTTLQAISHGFYL